jgi:hypothetical protein
LQLKALFQILISIMKIFQLQVMKKTMSINPLDKKFQISQRCLSLSKNGKRW